MEGLAFLTKHLRRPRTYVSEGYSCITIVLKVIASIPAPVIVEVTVIRLNSLIGCDFVKTGCLTVTDPPEINRLTA